MIVRAKFRVPLGKYLSGSPVSQVFVSPGFVFAWLTISIGPVLSWFNVGSSIFEQPELKAPMTATSAALATWSVAFFAHAASSHAPLAAVALSYVFSVMS